MQVIYTRNGYSVSPQSVAHALDLGEINRRTLENNFVVFFEAQSITGRRLNDQKIQQLRATSRSMKTLVSTRWDLFYTVEGFRPGLLQNWNRPYGGPTWDFIPGGTHKIQSPLRSSGGVGLSRKHVSDVESMLASEGWRFLNSSAKPWGFGLPYYPRVDHKKKTILYNQQKMQLNASDWQHKITSYVSIFEQYVRADGILFQFVKPQQYGNRDSSTLVQYAQDGRLNEFKKKSLRFDHAAESALAWFRGLFHMFEMMMAKKNGLMVVDLNYFGIPVWRYAKQIVDEWAQLANIPVALAAQRFYQAVESVGNRADYVIMGDVESVASKLPVYQVPDRFGASFNVIQTLKF